MTELKTRLISQPQRVEILSLLASHYVMKVMAALDYKGVTYTVRDISPLRQKKDIPAPHLVPVLLWGDEVIKDSSRILKFLDTHFNDTSMYEAPPITKQFASVEAAEAWIGDNFYEYCLYFQWLDPYGFEVSLMRALGKYLPIPECIQRCCSCCLSVRALTKGKRAEVRKRLEKSLGMQIMYSEASVKAGFRAVVQRLESCLTSDDQVYLLGTKGPSAADFTLYGMMIRMVDEAFDAHVDPCCPRLFEEYAAPRLREWYRRMKAQFPLQFFNRDKLQRR